MSSKALIFLGLVFAVVILLSSEEATATARDLKSVEEAMMETNGDGVEDVKSRFGGGHHGHGHRHHRHCHHGCCGHHHGGCSRCCSFAGEAVDAEPQAKPGN